MKKLLRARLAVLLFGFLALTLSGAREPLAMDSATQMIRTNALLLAVYDKNPAAGMQFAKEVETFLASAEQGKLPKDGAKGPKFKRRGGAAVQPGDPESEMERQNKRVFEENPALRKMYFHSPVAYLRMLKRLRQAAAAGGQAAAQ